MSFWTSLSPAFSILAPMEDVTDSVFRRIIHSCGSANVYFTEFTNVEGLQSEGREQVKHRLHYVPDEKNNGPLVAQIWGVTPEDYYYSAKQIAALGFDGVDINMGCPVKKVIKQGACSALITNHTLAQEIIEAAKQGSHGLPVSVKTRIGFDSVDTENWIGFLLQSCMPAALTIHGRTVRELSKVPCHFDEIRKAVEIRNSLGLNIPIIANGDILNIHHGKELCASIGTNGYMIGRGVFSNPWCFNPHQHTTEEGIYLSEVKINVVDRLQLLISHITLWRETWGESKNYQGLKKFFKIYIQGFHGASGLRASLMETTNPQEGIDVAQSFIDNQHTS